MPHICGCLINSRQIYNQILSFFSCNVLPSAHFRSLEKNLALMLDKRIDPIFLLFYRSSHRRCFIKKVLLKTSLNSQENTCVRVSFLIKLRVSGLQFYYKRDSGTGFFLIIWKIFENTFLTEHFWTTASNSRR